MRDLIARTERRGREGANQTYPEHAGKKPAPKVALPLIRPDCAHMGTRLPGEPCGSLLLTCNHFGDVTTRVQPCSAAQRCCATCSDYVQSGKPG